MKPTVGRIVHYTDGEGRTCAAMIVKVVDSPLVNLLIFEPDGIGQFWRERVPFADNASRGFWSWPPRV